MKKYVLAIDQGTTSTRAVIVDKTGALIEKSQREITLIYPHNGWVEADAVDIWISVVECINELLIKANITWKNIDSIGITNQRESVVVFNKDTGMPIYNAIIWQSRQSEEIANRFVKDNDLIESKTGLRINTYFSATKIKFILENVKDADKLFKENKLSACTIDSWILYKLTKGKSFYTDVSNASRTLLFNIHTMKYDDELIKLFGLSKKMLPEVKESSANFGKAEYFAVNVPICSLIGDQQSALFGQTCFSKGEFKVTYGTGCFMLLNTGNEIISSKNGLISTIAWKLNDKVFYALEGSVFIGGAVIQWLRDSLNIIENASDSETCARSVKSTRDIYFVPAFVGLGAPYWDDDARGTIFGLTRASNKNHIARAALESIAYQVKDLVQVMEKDTNLEMKEVKVDGGATANGYLMQFQADILQKEMVLPKFLETTALGTAYLAGLYTKFYPSMAYIKKIHAIKCTYAPLLDKATSDKLYEGWQMAVASCRTFKFRSK
jgi:glycerol kinase